MDKIKEILIEAGIGKERWKEGSCPNGHCISLDLDYGDALNTIERISMTDSGTKYRAEIMIVGIEKDADWVEISISLRSIYE